MTPAAKTLPNTQSDRNIPSYINILLCLLNPIFASRKKSQELLSLILHQNNYSK